MNQSFSSPHAKGNLALVLHAHLPLVQAIDSQDPGDERWLHEAVAECYLPLLQRMEMWQKSGVPWRLTLSLSPPLLRMLATEGVRDRISIYLKTRSELASQEALHWRSAREPRRKLLCEFYEQRFTALHRDWCRRSGDLIKGWCALVPKNSDEPNGLCLITTSSTHAILPLLEDSPRSIQAQIEMGLATSESHFGFRPKGFWLPECAWSPKVDEFLRSAGVHWTILETHGLMGAKPNPRRATLAPAVTPRGILVFGRDIQTATQVWSRKEGYPGHGDYREFHRDLAHDQSETDDPVVPTGLKLHRVTGAQDWPKEIYDPALAANWAQRHARDFLEQRRRQVSEIRVHWEGNPLWVAPYDAELFGHWWYEGPEFLDSVINNAGEFGVRLVSPEDYCHSNGVCEVVEPATSTWGEGSGFATWLDPSNAWMQQELRSARQRLWAVRGDDPPSIQWRRAQEELMLAEASDWPFLLRAGTASETAKRRFLKHLGAFFEHLRQVETLRKNR